MPDKTPTPILPNVAVAFTDIVSSSTMWRWDSSAMSRVLDWHQQQVETTTRTYQGMILKSIGDSFMVLFVDHTPSASPLARALDWAAELQQKIRIASRDRKSFLTFKDPNSSSKKMFQIRIGIANGPVYAKQVNLQHCKNFLDVFGNTVNVASRLESKISVPGGFGVWKVGEEGNEGNEEIGSRRLSRHYTLTEVNFSDRRPCKRGRSSRLLSPSDYQCTPVENLRGISIQRAYLFRPK